MILIDSGNLYLDKFENEYEIETWERLTKAIEEGKAIIMKLHTFEHFIGCG